MWVDKNAVAGHRLPFIVRKALAGLFTDSAAELTVALILILSHRSTERLLGPQSIKVSRSNLWGAFRLMLAFTAPRPSIFPALNTYSHFSAI